MYLLLASFLMLAIIQLNYWMAPSEISLTWDPTEAKYNYLLFY